MVLEPLPEGTAAPAPPIVSTPVSELGERLRDLRGDRSQKWLADLIGVSTALVSSWESGRAVPPSKRLVAIVEAVDGAPSMLDELMSMRDDAEDAGIPRVGRERREPLDLPTERELLQDIRWLLRDILDELRRR